MLCNILSYVVDRLQVMASTSGALIVQFLRPDKSKLLHAMRPHGHTASRALPSVLAVGSAIEDSVVFGFGKFQVAFAATEK